MIHWPQHIPATTIHARRASPGHSFRYGVDYLLINPEARVGPALFSRNRLNLFSILDRNHGGTPGNGRGAKWARTIFADRGVSDAEILLLTQPGLLGYVFNPVSFWLAMKGDTLLAVIAEVNNTYGDRHSYFCSNPDLSPINRTDRISVEKLMYVSPFQDNAGCYTFAFDIRPEKIAIRIDFRSGDKGLTATLTGPLTRLTNTVILSSLLLRPFGAMRTITLIHWQALRLKLKGARFRTRPLPPDQEVS